MSLFDKIYGYEYQILFTNKAGEREDADVRFTRKDKAIAYARKLKKAGMTEIFIDKYAVYEDHDTNFVDYFRI